jgi:rubredoxin
LRKLPFNIIKEEKKLQKYICSICGFVYDEAKGSAESGIAPGTVWADVPEDWVCPLCGAGKAEFVNQTTKSDKPKPSVAAVESSDEVRELSPLEVSALCTNLARGCEKQYKLEEAALFRELADHFKSAATPAKDPSFEKLLELIENDLEQGFVTANAVAAEQNDRGAKRALVWSEKVTRILKSILNRYLKEGDAMLEKSEIYVCTICGFIYIGNNLPELCPVCKVPNWKFERIQGGQNV